MLTPYTTPNEASLLFRILRSKNWVPVSGEIGRRRNLKLNASVTLDRNRQKKVERVRSC